MDTRPKETALVAAIEQYGRSIRAMQASGLRESEAVMDAYENAIRLVVEAELDKDN